MPNRSVSVSNLVEMVELFLSTPGLIGRNFWAATLVPPVELFRVTSRELFHGEIGKFELIYKIFFNLAV